MFQRSVPSYRDIQSKGAPPKPFVSLVLVGSICLVTLLHSVSLALHRGQQGRQANLNRQLVLAVRGLDVDQTRQCLRAGAAPNLLDPLPTSGKIHAKKGIPLLRSVLERAETSRDQQKGAEIALLLLKAGAEADCPYDPVHDPYPRETYASPLAEAAEKRLPQVVQALLAHGANANPEGLSPLYLVAGCEDPRMALLLLAHGANPNYQNSLGHTPLIIAVGVGDKVLVSALLAKGANLALKNWSGETALAEARRLGKWDLVPLLSQHARKKGVKRRKEGRR